MKNRILNLFFFLGLDIVFAELSLIISYLLLNDKLAFNAGLSIENFTYLSWPFAVMFSLYIFKIYNTIWQHYNFMALLHFLPATAMSVAVTMIAEYALYSRHLGYKFFISAFCLINLFLISYRLVFNEVYTRIKRKLSNKNQGQISLEPGNVMLIGAGSAGETVIKEFARRKGYQKSKIKCVIDDNLSLKGNYISGVKVVGDRNSIISYAEKYDIKTIIFAIPNCPQAERTKILNICQKTDCDLKIVPSVCKMYSESELSSLSSAIRNVEIEDLLGRDVIDVNSDTNLEYLENKVVLVTGGGGTIGSELCRQIATHNPKSIIILDIYENSAYEIQNELKYTFPDLKLYTLIGSVRDSKRLDYVFKTYKPNIVFHAAAHKHVPLMEESPNETVKNNIFGTLKTAECADRYGCEKMVLISTDKAVNPTNIMGASKRICEMIVQTYNNRSKTEFVAVRFGNVLGSNGSVIPLFKEQIKHGGPVTVTDPNIIRYFMTIPEAVSLVLQAGENAKGGEIFVLDMGNPVKILDLAENLIKLSGFTPYKDINIVFTGLRPGEKLYEELLMSEEGLTETDNNLIYIGKPIAIEEEELYKSLDKMKAAMYDESADVRKLVKEIVPTYSPNL
ncbi:MAG: polysaccharide biosynthesis protein [Clostridia bacterium]|nr:polysaccharide biosynthesis protein [Clostridia bacterium]